MTINFLNIIQVLVAIALIGFILIQRGPGATAGSAFGGGASGTVFGAKGSGSFLTKSTAILATAFFIITMLIAIDARDTYSATGEQAEQDLGVFGTLDTDTQEPAIIPTGDNDGASDVVDELSDVVDSVDDTVKETAADVDAMIDDATTEVDGKLTEVKEAAESMTDNVEEKAAAVAEEADGDNNQ